MPAVNSKILKVDYNSIRDKVIGVLGFGSGNFGYGQQARIQSTAVTDSSKVTVNEWANLRYDIINAYKHIFGSNPVMAVPVVDTTIRYTSSFTPDTGSLDVPQKQYDTWADTITNNRFTVAGGESATTAVVSSSRTGSWITQCQCVIQVYWANSNDARYWFNSGGKIRISASRSGGTTSNQNTSWTSLLSAAGTQAFGAATPGVGTSPNDGTNWYKTTSTFQTYYTATASSPYGSNTYQLQARCVDQPSNSGGGASQLEIRVLFTDGYVDPGIVPGSVAFPQGTRVGSGTAGGGVQTATTSMFPPDDLVDGTLTANVSSLYATGIMVPASDTFAVTQPIIAISAVTGS
jgi:hypothetical protein